MEERAAGVIQYLAEVKDVPMRRILVPVGYGITRPVASNSDAKGRELNRRVDIKVLVNQALAPNIVEVWNINYSGDKEADLAGGLDVQLQRKAEGKSRFPAPEFH
jgi:hypothetical protein